MNSIRFAKKGSLTDGGEQRVSFDHDFDIIFSKSANALPLTKFKIG